jgi:biotin operon repressor
MTKEDLKRAILQYLLKHQREWTAGVTLRQLFGCSRRSCEHAIEMLRRNDKVSIIADKGKIKGYKISYDPKECKEYYDRRERELRTQWIALRTERIFKESGELFAQKDVVAKLIEEEMEN